MPKTHHKPLEGHYTQVHNCHKLCPGKGLQPQGTSGPSTWLRSADFRRGKRLLENPGCRRSDVTPQQERTP